MPSVNWTNPAGGDWDTPGNWSTGQVPGAGDDVVISQSGITVTHAANVSELINSLLCQGSLVFSGGSLSFTASSVITTLSLSGGSIGGTGDLTITGTLNWYETTIGGSGAVNIAAGALANLSESSLGGGYHVLDGRTFNNAGTMTLSTVHDYSSVSSKNLELQNGAVINNAGTFYLESGRRVEGAVGTFNNTGQLVAAAGGGGLGGGGIGVPFNNSGSIVVQGGCYFGAAGGGVSRGPITGANGTSIELDGFTISGALTGDAITVGSDTIAGTYQARSSTDIGYHSGTTSFTGTVLGVGNLIVDPIAAADFSPATGGPVTLTLASYTSNNGGLTGTDNFVVTGVTKLSYGYLGGAGNTLEAQGGLDIVGGATLDNCSLVNDGAAVWDVNNQDRAGIGTIGPVTITNLGTFRVQGNHASVGSGDTQGISRGADTSQPFPIFDNRGSFVKVTPGNRVSFDGHFLNSGSIDVQGGVLSISDLTGTGTSSGPITAADGTDLDLTGFTVTGALTGDAITLGDDTIVGTYQARSGTNVNAFTVVFTGTVLGVGNLDVEQNGNTAVADFSPATGGPVSLTLTSYFSRRGTLRGTDSFVVTGLTTLSEAGLVSSTGSSLTALGGMAADSFGVGGNFHLITPAGRLATITTGTVYMGGTATWDNAGTLSFHQAGIYGPNQAASFNNSGLVESFGSLGITVDHVSNTGTLHELSGQLSVGYGNGQGASSAVNTGTVLGEAGTTLYFPGVFTSAAGSSILGDAVIFDGGAAVAGTYQARSSTDVAINREADFSGPVLGVGALSVEQGAVADFSPSAGGPATPTSPSLILGPNARLSGTDNFVVTSPFTWSGGAFVGHSGQGSLTVQGGMTITGNVSAYDFGFINPATTTWSGGNVAVFGADSSFTNTVTGTFDDQVDGTFGNCDGNCANFVNQGLFLKSGGGGTTNLQMDLVNSGRVVIQNGSLNLGCGYVQAPGSGGGSGGTISGTFTGTISNPGQLDLVPAPTPPPVVTAYTQTVTGILNEQIGGLRAGTQYGQIAVTGSVNLAGTLNVALINGFTPHLGDQFRIIDNQGTNPISGSFTGLPEWTPGGRLVFAGSFGFGVSYVGGDGNDVVLTAKQAATTTALVSSANPSVFGQAVTLTATVSAAAGTPTGSVDFRDTTANVDLGTVNVSGGAAMLSTSAFAVGNHVITASYSGAPAFVPSSGTLTQTVNKDATTTAIASSANPSDYGQGVTFTATVRANAPGSGTPTGTVSFYYDAIDPQHQIGQQISLSNGSAASAAISSLSASGHTIYAVSSGDGNFNNGQGSLTQTVLSAQQQVALIINQVNALVSAGALNSGNGIALKAKLNSATASLNAGNTTAAINQLNAFINQVTAFQKTGKLGTAQAQALISAANRAIASASGSSGAHLMNDSSAATSASTDNLPVSNVAQLVTGAIWVYFTDSTGNITADEQGRFDDALNTLNATFGTYGVALVEVSAAADAIVEVAIAATSPAGSAADGVLGCTVAGQITLVTGWDWYTGAAPSAIGAVQYDFQTIVTHELGHAVGLGHSGDTGSVMYAYLAPGQARRGVTTQDLSVLDTDAGRTPEPLTAAPWHDHQASAQPVWPALIDRPQTPGTSNRAGEQGGIALFEMFLSQTRLGPWPASASVNSSPVVPLHGSPSAVPPFAEATSAQTSSTPDHHAVGKSASRAVDKLFAGWFADAREEGLWGRLR